MILASEVINGLKAELDATGSKRYDNSRDYFPAIDKGQEYLVTLFNAAFAANKITEESLRELIVTRVFQCSQFSRLNLYDSVDKSTTQLFQDHIWSLLGVHPECRVIDKNGNIPLSGGEPVLVDKLRSVKTDFLMAPSPINKTAERLSIEEWNEVDSNIFKRGSVQVTNDYKSYSYLNWGEHRPIDTTLTIFDQSQSVGPEIEIKPALNNKYVGVTYLQAPTKVTATTDQIKFPRTLFNLMVGKSLDYITRKSYDRESFYKVTQGDVTNLINMMT